MQQDFTCRRKDIQFISLKFESEIRAFALIPLLGGVVKETVDAVYFTGVGFSERGQTLPGY